MTRFLDGPAKGATLLLRRAPVYLRARVDEKGKVDALDSLLDFAHPSERLAAYRITTTPGRCSIRKTDGSGGIFTFAEYALCQPQPEDEIMRNNLLWQSWVESLPPYAIPDPPE